MRWLRGSCAALVVAVCSSFGVPAAAAVPHASFRQLSFGNGYGFGVWDGDAKKLVTLTEHPYKSPNATSQTRDVVYDAYFGARASGGSAWLTEVPIDALGYEQQSAVVHATQHVGPLQTETYAFSPWKLSAPSVVLVLRVTNTSSSAIPDAAAFALLNLHLGNGAPRPDTSSEHTSYDAASDAISETGASGLTARYISLTPSTAHTATAASATNPYFVVKGGGDLVNTDDSGTVSDAVAAFEWSLAAIAPGETKWVGVLVTLGSDTDGRAWWGKRAPDALVSSELSDWEAFRKPPPSGLSAAETRVWRQAETILRVAQSREPAPSKGQIVAALPPGQWWISWVRDMSYATAALFRMGHTDEGNAAIDFFKGAKVGGYKSQVGTDYSISVVRYFGDGEEESDTNENGPNIEFDGFGLAPWAAHVGGRSDLDDSANKTLTQLLDPTGLVKADSSIWEVHWNGQQRRFAYTSIAGARGLCSAGNTEAARKLQSAITSNLLRSDGAIGQSYEAISSGKPSVDAAVVEAINFGLVDPKGPIAERTYEAIDGALRVPTGRGYQRNQDGGGYDSQEWLFIDLRLSAALRRMGRTIDADQLLGWVTAQAELNFDLIPELYDRNTGDYTGSIPMVGFGAGAYIHTLLDRASPPPADSCFATSPTTGGDAGGSTPDAGGASDTGAPGTSSGTSSSGGCASSRPQPNAFSSALLLLALASMSARRGAGR